MASDPGVRVLHVLTSDHRRGAESFAVALAASLDRPGCHHRTVALSLSGADSVLDVKVLGIRPRSPSTLRRLRAEMADANVVIAHGSKTLSACAAAGAGLRCRLVYKTIGDPRFWASTPGRRARYGLLLRRMDAIVAQSPRTAAQLQEDFGIASGRITAIGNGRDPARFPRADPAAKVAARTRWGLDPDRPIVAMLGSLSDEKRVDVAIAALALLPDFDLVIAGEGPQREALEKRAVQEIPGRVRFLGTVQDPASVLAAADVIALTSDSEGLPGVLIEAGFVGRPVVATDVGYVSDIVRDDRTGYLVPPDDPAATAAAIAGSYAQRIRLGDAAYSWHRANTSLEVVTARWDQLLHALAPPSVGPGRPPAGLRVLHVIDSLSMAGGAENSLVQVVPRLAEMGVDSRVVVLSAPGAAGVSILRDADVDVIAADGGRVAAILTIRQQIRRWRPDVVHTTLFEANLAGCIAAAITRVPAVASRVSTPYATTGTHHLPWKRRVVRAVERLVFGRLTVATHALTHAAAQAAVADLGVAGRRISVIPRGRDRALLGEPSPQRRQSARESLGLGPDDYVILNVARQQPVKRQGDLIAAFAAVRASSPHAVLLIAGHEGQASEALRTAVCTSGLSESVRILGHRDDVPELLAAADLFAFTSAAEGLGSAVLEAMAMEVPVVAYGIPAVSEVLGGHGVTVTPLDVAALARAISDCVGEDATVRRARTNAARRRFEEHYTIDGVARAMADWYADVVHRGVPSAQSSDTNKKLRCRRRGSGTIRSTGTTP